MNVFALLKSTDVIARTSPWYDRTQIPVQLVEMSRPKIVSEVIPQPEHQLITVTFLDNLSKLGAHNNIKVLVV
jgi:hypothetical protein